MRRIALAFLVVLAGCSAPAIDQRNPRPDPPVIVADPPLLPPDVEVTTTAPPANGAFPVDILTDPAPSRGGMDALGTFVLEYDAELNCLYHIEEDNNGEPGTGGRIVIQWPFGYTATHQNGKVIVFDDNGKPVTASGVEFQLGGGGDSFDGAGVPGGCDAIGIWYANGDPLAPG